jgi:2-dehydro-3-deoxygluconokinase
LTDKVVCFGELLLRLAAPGRELLLQTGRLDVHVGGAEANVAVGLACLGHAAAMVSRVPDNVLGEAARAHLRRYGVDHSGVSVSPTGRMGLYFLAPGAGPRAAHVVYDRDDSAFQLARPGDLRLAEALDGAAWLHVSGVTPALGNFGASAAGDAIDAARERGVRVSFDVNYRPSLWQGHGPQPAPTLARLAASADLLFANHHDLAMLLDIAFDGEGEARRRAAAQAAFAAWPQVEMIASTARHVVEADTHRLSARLDARDGAAQTDEVVIAGIVDRIGAGDAFAAGILHGLVTGLDREATARAGLGLAVLKHSLPGDASLFARRDLDAWLAGERDVRR